MHRTAVILMVVLGLAIACDPDTGPDTGVPPWLSAMISQFESQPVANPPLYVASYWYNGRTAYYVPPRCCDIPSVLYEVSGAVICHPDGGLTGNGDGRCSDFFTARMSERIIWKDYRALPAG